MISAMQIASIQNDWVGRVIGGQFPLLQWLGGTGHSGVFLTELAGTPSQKAAIKLMPDEAGVETRIATAADASHTYAHLVRVLQNGRCEIDGSSFIYVVTEYADEVLSEILLVRPLTPDEVKEMLTPVLDTLSELHAHGLVHGGLKPSNILVVNDQLKLSAGSVQPATGSADEKTALKIYDAPERAAGAVSPASDIWSLGVTVVEALTQRTPDWNRTENVDPRIPDSVPQPFAGIAAACLRVDPASRATLEDVSSQLETPVPVVAAPAVAAPQPEPALVAESEPAGKPVGVLLAVVAILLAAVAAIFWWHSRAPQPAPQSSDQLPAQSSAPAGKEPEQQVNPSPAPPSAVSPAPTQSNGIAVKGVVAQKVMPDVLPSASDSIRGSVTVLLRLNVSSTGDVTDAEFESAGPSKYFSRIAMDAARQWKFKPSRVNGQPEASVWTLQFVFTRDNTDVSAEQTSP
jgi:TonB family protein